MSTDYRTICRTLRRTEEYICRTICRTLDVTKKCVGTRAHMLEKDRARLDVGA